MRKVNSEIGQIYVGFIPPLGAVIFDPNSQRGLGDDQVRLFKCVSEQSGTFVKKIVRDKLVALDEAVWQSIQPVIAAYVAAMRSRRVAHCYRCKEHLDSVDFSLCGTCRWIRCSCGCCGCGYSR